MEHLVGVRDARKRGFNSSWHRCAGLMEAIRMIIAGDRVIGILDVVSGRSSIDIQRFVVIGCFVGSRQKILEILVGGANAARPVARADCWGAWASQQAG